MRSTNKQAWTVSSPLLMAVVYGSRVCCLQAKHSAAEFNHRLYYVYGIHVISDRSYRDWCRKFRCCMWRGDTQLWLINVLRKLLTLWVTNFVITFHICMLNFFKHWEPACFKSPETMGYHKGPIDVANNKLCTPWWEIGKSWCHTITHAFIWVETGKVMQLCKLYG